MINSQRIVDRINADFPEAACVEMEGGGFLAGIERYSAMNGGRPMRGFIVRGISDYACRKDSDAIIRREASNNAALVALRMAEWLIAPERLGLVLG